MFMPSLYPADRRADASASSPASSTLDPDALEATVDGFNAAVRPGTFDDTILDDCRTEGLTPPKTHWARRIETRAVLCLSGAARHHLHLSGDAREQGNAHADEATASRRANMFAAGEIMAGNVLGRGYAAGIGMTIGSVFGRIAGREAAAQCPQLRRRARGRAITRRHCSPKPTG